MKGRSIHTTHFDFLSCNFHCTEHSGVHSGVKCLLYGNEIVKMHFLISFWLLQYITYHILSISLPQSPPPKGFNWLQLLTIVTIMSLFTDRIVRTQCLRHEASLSTGLSGYPLCIVNFLQFHLTSFSQIL